MIFWFIKLRKANADLRRENSLLREENKALRHSTKYSGTRDRREGDHGHPTGIFFGVIELRHGVPVGWHHNELLLMTAEEQYETNVKNGHLMPPRHA